MDIACFFIGKPKGTAERVWEGSGWNAQHSLEILKDKCLVEETEIWVYQTYGSRMKPGLRMHDHLRDIGREMASELRRPLRLWRPHELKYLESMGLKKILAKKDLRCFHTMFDKSMNCLVTFFLGQPDICIERSSSVLWLHLHGSFKLVDRIPSWISLRYVQCLNIQRGQLKTLWKNGKQAPSQLKELQIGLCEDLEKLSLAHLSCLQELAIVDCCHLKSVRGINDLPKLVELKIYGCGKVEFECLRLSGMRCLEMIIFDRNVMVKHFEVDNCQNLETIKYGCRNVVRSGSPDYPEREKLLIFEDLVCLVGIIINGCGDQFKCLRLLECQNLKTVRGNLEIGELEVRDCRELEELPRSSSTEKIHIASCRKFEKIVLPTSLTSLSLKRCSDLRRVSTTSDLKMLTEFYIEDCPEVEELPNFSSLSRMQRIRIASCGKLENIVLPTRLFLKELVIDSPEKLQNMANIDELHVEEYMRLCICSNAVIRNCIDKLKNVPKASIVIGRAVEGAESRLNEYLFSEAHSVFNIVKFDATYLGYWIRFPIGVLIPMLCSVVVVDSSSSLANLIKHHWDNYCTLLPPAKHWWDNYSKMDNYNDRT